MTASLTLIGKIKQIKRSADTDRSSSFSIKDLHFFLAEI